MFQIVFLFLVLVLAFLDACVNFIRVYVVWEYFHVFHLSSFFSSVSVSFCGWAALTFWARLPETAAREKIGYLDTFGKYLEIIKKKEAW